MHAYRFKMRFNFSRLPRFKKRINVLIFKKKKKNSTFSLGTTKNILFKKILAYWTLSKMDLLN